MNSLKYSLKRLTAHNRDGSRATQANRHRGLFAMADDLHGLGFHLKDARNLKPRHVEALVEAWKAHGIADATIRNRLGWCRWWADRVGKPGLLPGDNAGFGLAERTPYQGSRARTLSSATLARLNEPRIALALRLEAAFGLRREEALKFRPAFADHGDRIVLKPSWCKNGRGREIAVVDAVQRQLLNELHRALGDGSLIPAGMSYVRFLQIYKARTRAAGLGNAHGLRHAYAQRLYRTLTGRECPARGGMTAEAMTQAERDADVAARLRISRDLGHNRLEVTDTYLGRRWMGGHHRRPQP